MKASRGRRALPALPWAPHCQAWLRTYACPVFAVSAGEGASGSQGPAATPDRLALGTTLLAADEDFAEMVCIAMLQVGGCGGGRWMGRCGVGCMHGVHRSAAGFGARGDVRLARVVRGTRR